MRRRAGALPVNHIGGERNERVVIERLALADLPELAEWSLAPSSKTF